MDVPDSKEGKMEFRVIRKSRSGLVGGVVLALVFAMPSLAAGRPTTTVTASLGAITCDLDGAGLEASATATISRGTLGYASLWVGEVRTVTGPYVAYDQPWMVSSWSSYDSFARGTGPATDSRTLDTSDSTTWNRHDYAQELWGGRSQASAWWSVNYFAYAGYRGSPYADWVQAFVNCATSPPTIVDAASLSQATWVSEPGLR